MDVVAADPLPPDEDRQDWRPGAQGQNRQAPGGRGRLPEEGHEHALPAGRILIQQDGNEAAATEGIQHRPQRAALVDQLHPGLAAHGLGLIIEDRRIERPDDDRGRIPGQAVGQGQILPVAEMRGENEGATVVAHDLVHVLAALERDLLQRRLQRSMQEPGKLDDGHAEVLPSLAGQPSTGALWQIGKGERQIGQSDPATPWQGQPGEIPETPADPERERRRESGESRR